MRGSLRSCWRISPSSWRMSDCTRSVRRDTTHDPSSPLLLDLDDREGLDNVAFLHVADVLQADAAFVAGSHFAGIVLEAPQRVDLAAEGHIAVAQDARGRVAHDLAIGHIATEDDIVLAD